MVTPVIVEMMRAVVPLFSTLGVGAEDSSCEVESVLVISGLLVVFKL